MGVFWKRLELTRRGSITTELPRLFLVGMAELKKDVFNNEYAKDTKERHQKPQLLVFRDPVYPGQSFKH